MKPRWIGALWLAVIGGLVSGALFHAPQARAAGAASLYVSPVSGTFTVGSTFTVSIFVNTSGQFINAIEANLSFPPDKLQVVSPTAGKSIIQLWVVQPTYSNTEGILKFQGAIPTPGIATEAGLLSTIIFRVKSTGTATLKFLDSSKVLLNDGRGTDILGQTTDGLYHLALPAPAGPTVTSPTNPDQEKWYATRNAALRWAAVPGVEGYSYVLNEFPVDEPDDISEGLRDFARYPNIADGEYYFHIKSLRGGVWGGTTHFAVRADNTPPAAFEMEFSPSNYTSNRRPIVSFETTDAASGLDHYELRFIPLDPPPEDKKDGATPFFIEVSSPYSQQLAVGRYDVVVRAYDKAGNSYQAVKRLTVTFPIFEIIHGRGLRFGGTLTVSWPYVWLLSLILLLILFFLSRSAWHLHRKIEDHLTAGAHHHPLVKGLIEALREKQRQYFGKGGGTSILMVILLILSFGFLAGRGAMAQTLNALQVEPPVVTLFPKSIGNDEILYIGGRAGAPEAQVLIYLQNIESGSTLSFTAATDKNGAWFYSFPQFLSAGRYLAWTQLKVFDELSPPSSRLDLTVAPTALQIGSERLSYQDLYLILMIIFGTAALGLGAFIWYHSHHARQKSRRLTQEIKEVEESLRRGFAILRRDIDAELAVVRKVKMSKELSREEREREEQLLQDLAWVEGHTAKEVWDIERLS